MRLSLILLDSIYFKHLNVEDNLKKWIQKFVEQLETKPLSTDSSSKNSSKTNTSKNTNVKDSTISDQIHDIADDRGTLLYVIDILGKNALDTETTSARKTRESLDGFAKEILQANHATDDVKLERVLFKFRQFISSQQIEEYSYVQKSFEDLRHLIWELFENLTKDWASEKKEEMHLDANLDQLREAVEANSIEAIKQQSRQFMQSYKDLQTVKNHRRSKRMDGFKKNLASAKKQLMTANNNLRVDHLTQAFNRRSFDEALKQQWDLFQLNKQPITLLMMDIDHFKKINDSYGHPIGDAVLIECVKMLKEVFHRDNDTLARIGGEEFAVLLPDFQIEHAVKKADQALERIRRETLIEKDFRIQFTISIGVAQLLENESYETWLKRADGALYTSKNSGRNRYSVAPNMVIQTKAG